MLRMLVLMRRTFTNILPALSLVTALISVACSSTAMPGNDGSSSGGAAGSGSGSGGAGGGASVDSGASCQSLIQDYAVAFAEARTCNPFLNTVQCDHLASSSLQCPNCPIHVNSTTSLDAIRAAFQARTDCPSAPCPAILCVNPGVSGQCVPDDGGSTGHCIDVR